MTRGIEIAISWGVRVKVAQIWPLDLEGIQTCLGEGGREQNSGSFLCIKLSIELRNSTVYLLFNSCDQVNFKIELFDYPKLSLSCVKHQYRVVSSCHFLTFLLHGLFDIYKFTPVKY